MIAVPVSDSSRILSTMSESSRLTRLQPNVFRLDRVGPGLVEQLRAHGAVFDHDPRRQCVEQIGVVRAIVHVSHRDRVVALCKLACVAMALLAGTQGLRWP